MAPVRADRRSTAHLYLILGEEDLRADDALRTLLDELIPEGERALNLDVIDAGEAPVQDIITRCDTLPFFGARRVVVLRRAQALKPPDQDALAAYLEQGPPPSVLVVVAERLDKRRRFHAVLQKSGRVIVCDPLRPGDLPGWVRTRVAREGKKITPDAAELLITVVGGHLRELSLEIGKLAAYTGGRDTITAEDVREVASHVAEATVFELMDAVGRRQAGRALALLETVIGMGEPPVRILYMLGDQLRMLLKTQVLADRTRTPSPAAVRDALGTRAWLYTRYREQVAAFGRIDAGRMLGLLLGTDEMIKTGLTPPRLAIEALIARLCLD